MQDDSILTNYQGDRFTVQTLTEADRARVTDIKMPDTGASYEKFRREQIALDCLKAMLLNPSVMNQSFDVIADFAFRQADAFLAKAREPQI